MKKYVKVNEANPNDIDIHKVAYLNPLSTDEDYMSLKLSIESVGQLEPIKLYKGKLIDGRHRLKAAKELNITIRYINLPETMTIEDVKAIVMGTEKRRHQTPTQKAISAYKYYEMMISDGSKISMGKAAEEYGSNRKMVDRAKKLWKLAGEQIMENLHDGAKLKVGENHPTDSMLTLINHFNVIREEMIQTVKPATGELTDDEVQYIKDMAQTIKASMNNVSIKTLISMIKGDIYV